MSVTHISSIGANDEDQLDCQYQLSTGNMSVKYRQNGQLDSEVEVLNYDGRIFMPAVEVPRARPSSEQMTDLVHEPTLIDFFLIRKNWILVLTFNSTVKSRHYIVEINTL